MRDATESTISNGCPEALRILLSYHPLPLYAKPEYRHALEDVKTWCPAEYLETKQVLAEFLGENMDMSSDEDEVCYLTIIPVRFD